MEIILYNKNGEPVAYIADDGETIYLWNGHAVAYLYKDKVYGWNGKHLGWFVDGIIYDLRGLIVCFIRSKCPVATYAEPASIQNMPNIAKYKYAKYARYTPHVKPAFSL